MKKWFSSKHDSQDIIEKVQGSLSLNLELPRSAQVENFEPEEGTRFVVLDGRYTFIALSDGTFIPFIGSQELLKLLPSVRIDEGAIKYIVNGADVMRPGVTSYDDWGQSGRIVVIRERKLDRGIAIGRATVSSAEVGPMAKGPCIENLHHVGDRFWNSYRQI